MELYWNLIAISVFRKHYFMTTKMWSWRKKIPNFSPRLWLIRRDWHQITTKKTIIMGIKLGSVKSPTQFAAIHPVTFLVRGVRKTTLEKSASSYCRFSFYVYYVCFMSMAYRPGITHIRSHIGHLTSPNGTSAQPHPSPPLRLDLPRTETPRIFKAQAI